MKDPLQKTESWKMFNRIAQQYDLLNRLLSGRLDVAWRKKCVKQIAKKEPLTVLDLATGTGDLLLRLLKERPNVKTAVGLDPAIEMLCVGRKKLSSQRASLVRGDAQEMSFKSTSSNVITMAFGIRNVPDIDKAFQEMHRVLVSGGHVLILEFSLPKNILIRSLYLLYFRYVLPFIGGIISRDRPAYRYLNQSVENFPYGATFCHRLKNAGFDHVTETPLTFGIATLYSAKKQ